MDRPRILYLTYDGLLEPLGQSQVLSYLERIASEFAITVLSFEKPSDARDDARVRALATRLDGSGIRWVSLRYRKRPPVLSTTWDILKGIHRAMRLARSTPPAVVHARSYVPSVIALAIAGRTGAKFVFDMRGFWVDEKVEAGSWRHGGVIYRAGKWFERRFLARADAVVSLTHEGVRALPQLGLPAERAVPVEVIPTCVDVRRFAPGPKDAMRLAALGLAGSRVVGSVGTLTNRYLREETLRYFAYLTRAMDELKILLVTRDDHAQLRRDAADAGLDWSRLVLASADFADMPALVRLFDAGVFFMKPVFAQKGSAATRLAEFLACGVPVIVNDGVADSSAIVRAERVGLVLPDTSPASFAASLAEVRALLDDADLRGRCRALAVRLFDADRGAERYAALYRRILAGEP